MLTQILIALIRLYQRTLSRLILAAVGPVCRFEPSCSQYAAACLEGQGPLRGTLLSVKRLCKCHPFHPGGFDPPPPPRIQGRASQSTTPIPDHDGGPPGQARSASLDEAAASAVPRGAAAAAPEPETAA